MDRRKHYWLAMAGCLSRPTRNIPLVAALLQSAGRLDYRQSGHGSYVAAIVSAHAQRKNGHSDRAVICSYIVASGCDFIFASIVLQTSSQSLETVNEAVLANYPV